VELTLYRKSKKRNNTIALTPLLASQNFTYGKSLVKSLANDGTRIFTEKESANHINHMMQKTTYKKDRLKMTSFGSNE
jgi:hypothetical protein